MSKLHIYTGQEIRTLRKTIKLSQSAFWEPLGVTQSGSSRYEAGRKIPKPVQVLLNLALGNPESGVALYDSLRNRIKEAKAAAIEAEKAKATRKRIVAQ